MTTPSVPEAAVVKPVKFEPPAPTVPADPHAVAGQFGHGPDYTWLQGVVRQHYRGHLELRYCEPSEEDEHGGKVILDDSPLLARCRDGDIIQVEGRLNADTAGRPDRSPRFRVDRMWPIPAKP